LRVAIFTDNFRTDMGGGTKVVYDLANKLKEENHEVLIVSGKTATSENGKFKILKLPSLKYPFYDNAEAIFPNFLLVKKLNEFSPDIIHFHDPFTAGITAVVAAKLLSKKVVGTIHIHPLHMTQYSLRFDNGLAAKKLVGFFSKFSDGLSFVSKEQMNLYSKYLSGEGNYRVIYPGIPDIFFTDKVPSFGKRVITVSRLAPEKNLFFAIRVISEIQRVMDVEYILVGNGPEREKLESYSLSIGAKVKFLGAVKREDLKELYLNSSVFFLPSKTETFGLVFAEAMACGLPVVALNKGSAPEVVGNGGIICEEDEKVVSKAISELLVNKELWVKKSKAAKRRAEVFNLNDFVKNFLEFYRTTIELGS